MRRFVDAKIADQLFQLRHGRYHERHVVARDAPTRLVVVAVHAAGNVTGRVGLCPATVYRRADIEDDQVGIGTMAVKPLHAHERLGVRPGYRGG
jgi:hypothetical protein